MLCVGWSAGLAWLARGEGGWVRQEAETRREKKDMLKFTFRATEHINQIEHELNKCIRKPNGTTWNSIPYTAYK
jgi:hypothetical protein